MARTYRRQYTKTIVRAPKKKWNKGNVFGSTPEPTSSAGVDMGFYYTIAQNSSDVSTPVPVTIQIKHVRSTGQITVASAALESTSPSPKVFNVYIIYVPQLMYELLSQQGTAAAKYNYMRGLIMDHPEYIMAQKTVNLEFDGGIPGEKKIKSFTITSGNLMRNLKSGDRILFSYMSRYVTNAHMYTNESYYAETSFVTRNV